MHDLLVELFPICRSITGDGLRATLRAIERYAPLEWHEVPTGTSVLDWTIPNEWNIRDAWLKDPAGRTIAAFCDSNLHVVNYSAPVHRHLTLAELRPHLFSLPDRPDWIPYRTTYYSENWGFCLPHRDVEQLVEGDYEVFIDSTIAPGGLSYGECVLPGTRAAEVLIACHACHPSMANDSLSGVVLTAFLAEAMAKRTRRYTYRFLFAPATIGSLAWLARRGTLVERVEHGLVLTCVGDPGPFTYKRSRRSDAEIDRAVPQVLRDRHLEHRVKEFSPYGGDERQFCSPGYDLAVGALTRTPYGEYPEYHTSADNLAFVTPDALEESLDVCLSVFDVLEANRRYVNLRPHGEPQLGRRGLFRATSGNVDVFSPEFALLWVLNLADGRHTLLDVAERSGLPFDRIREAARVLNEHELVEEIPDGRLDVGWPRTSLETMKGTRER
jgi:aminopeptidase-like protein